MKREREEDEHEISKSSKICCSGKIAANDIYIYLDLLVEILKKLPTRSLLRFRSVSKQWLNIIGSRDIVDMITARSNNLHFIFHHSSTNFPFFVFSSTYTYKEKEAVTTPPHYQYDQFMYQYVRGLICYSSKISPLIVTIYNPTTRQSITLPDIESQRRKEQHAHCFFGYDSVMNQYKVMCMINIIGKGNKTKKQVCKIYTLRDPMKRWRNIQGIGNHYPTLRGVHINGIIYYGARDNIDQIMLMSFDFNSERFYHVNAPPAVAKSFFHANEGMATNFWNSTLVNFKGKLGYLCSRLGEMWIMEDVENQTWSKTIFDLHENPFRSLSGCDCFSGVTLGGDIFIVQNGYKRKDPLYIYYYNLKQNSLRRSEIKGTTQRSMNMYILGVSDHIEILMSLKDM